MLTTENKSFGLPRKCRLIVNLPLSAAINMAMDEYSLKKSKHDNSAILRFYEWEGWCLSLGYSQGLRGLLLDNMRKHDVYMVRRITGGRAVLHGADLTYCLTLPSEKTFVADHIYAAIAKAFQESLLGAGLSPQIVALSKQQRTAHSSADCFLSPARNELLLDGKKVLGNAQRIGTDGLMQHGSLAMRDDRLMRKLIFKDAQHTQQHFTSLQEQKLSISTTDIISALQNSFAQALGVELEADDWRPEELETIKNMAKGYPNLIEDTEK